MGQPGSLRTVNLGPIYLLLCLAKLIVSIPSRGKSDEVVIWRYESLSDLGLLEEARSQSVGNQRTAVAEILFRCLSQCFQSAVECRSTGKKMCLERRWTTETTWEHPACRFIVAATKHC